MDQTGYLSTSFQRLLTDQCLFYTSGDCIEGINSSINILLVELQ